MQPACKQTWYAGQTENMIEIFFWVLRVTGQRPAVNNTEGIDESKRIP